MGEGSVEAGVELGTVSEAGKREQEIEVGRTDSPKRHTHERGIWRENEDAAAGRQPLTDSGPTERTHSPLVFSIAAAYLPPFMDRSNPLDRDTLS